MKPMNLSKERAAARRRRKLYRLKNHPFVVPVITFLFLFFATMVGFIFLNSRPVAASDSHIVRLTINGKVQIIPTRAKTVADLLNRAKVALNDGDVVEPASNTPIQEDNFRVNIYRAKPITIFDGDRRLQTLSAASTPRSVAAQAGVTVYPEDTLTVASTNNILQEGVLGEKIVIDRATPVALNLYGTPVTVRTHTKTVADLIKEKQIKLASGDSLQPDSATAISAGMQVFVIRKGTQIVTEEVAIDMPVQYVDDPNLSFGTTAVRQQGAPGQKIVTYQVDTQNGQETGRHVIQEVVQTQPVTQIVARGKAVYIPGDSTVLMAAAGIASSDYPYVNYIVSRESGWCPTKWQGEIGSCPAFYEDLHDPSSGYGYGLCQSTPAIKMSSAGSDWSTNPITQLHWCSGYASRYGGWAGAYNHWVANGNW